MSDDLNFHREHSRLSAAQLARWQGLPLAWLDVAGTAHNRVAHDLPVLALIDAGTAEAEIAYGARKTRLQVQPGSMGLFDAEEEHTSTWRCAAGRRIMLKLDLPWLAARGLVTEDWPRLRLRRELEFQDPALAGLLRLMVREVAEGCPSGPLVAEALSMGLATRLITSHGMGLQPLRERSTLTGAQRRRVDDLIAAQLAGPLPLAELAAAAGFSAPHFTRLFRRTLGVSPHQYVLQKRVQHAQALLETTALDLAAVALAAGFASQSHMTAVFGKQLGATPGAVRARRRA
jgi:AraC-like DNA-binding protein